MKPVSGRVFARALERHGWRLMRIQGSHHIDGKAGAEVRISVPIHANAPLKLGLQLHLAKLAGISEKDLR